MMASRIIWHQRDAGNTSTVDLFIILIVVERNLSNQYLVSSFTHQLLAHIRAANSIASPSDYFPSLGIKSIVS